MSAQQPRWCVSNGGGIRLRELTEEGYSKARKQVYQCRHGILLQVLPSFKVSIFSIGQASKYSRMFYADLIGDLTFIIPDCVGNKRPSFCCFNKWTRITNLEEGMQRAHTVFVTRLWYLQGLQSKGLGVVEEWTRHLGRM